MKWFYTLPVDRRLELTETVWNPTFDSVIAALGGRSRENDEIAIAAANTAIFRAHNPFKN